MTDCKHDQKVTHDAADGGVTQGRRTKSASPNSDINVDNNCVDDDHGCQERNEADCDSDPTFMLIHCRKKCLICVPDIIVQQDVGFGKTPLHVSIQILQIVRETNLYHRQLKSTMNNSELYCHDDDDNKHDGRGSSRSILYAQQPCRDSNQMCAFWKFQRQCTNIEYAAFMERECPLTCQRCDVLKAKDFLSFLLHDLTMVYYNNGDRDKQNENMQQLDRNVVADRHRALSFLMTSVGMDPSLLTTPFSNSDGNWLFELHTRVRRLVPSALLKLYNAPNGGTMTREEKILLFDLHGVSSARNDDDDDNLDSRNMFDILIPYRARGYIVSAMRDYDHLITRPIQLGIGFAIPNQAAVQTISEMAGPVMQMGAGAGYWAALLQQNGIDVVAYDINPPKQPSTVPAEGDARGGRQNAFFDVSYFNSTREGSCTNVFAGNKMLAKERTLLMIWPNDPDPTDNPQFCIGTDCLGSQAVWDADCLMAFLAAGGERVIYVGERERHVSIHIKGGADCGISSSRRFQTLLEENFRMVKRVKIPQWWLNEDDLSVWELNR
ncbi:hypothetical protein MHU86_1526 [Fragilaria crotonensis]|nr:hypothetical protein MHU86_1526 [Fragilaria crotonensis]